MKYHIRRFSYELILGALYYHIITAPHDCKANLPRHLSADCSMQSQHLQGMLL